MRMTRQPLALSVRVTNRSRVLSHHVIKHAWVFCPDGTRPKYRHRQNVFLDRNGVVKISLAVQKLLQSCLPISS